MISNQSYSQEKSDITYRFTQTDSSYTFKGSFRTNFDPHCILNICFQIEHVCALAPDAKHIILKDHGTNWNQISYTYRKFIYFENKSLWYRTLDKEKLRIDFKLISSKNNSSLMPRMLSSKGYYLIYPKENSFIVEYYQQCILSESLLTNIYLNQAKKEVINFLIRFNEYSKSTCNSSK